MSEAPPAAAPRLKFPHVAPEPNRLLTAITAYADQSGLGAGLLDLVWVRVSLINGCPYCIQAHTSEAIAHGERVERLFQLRVWEESPVFSERERTALAWADAVTTVRRARVPDELYARARSQFSEKELVDLTWAIVAMNSWNRLSIAFRVPPRIPPPSAPATPG